MRNLLFAFATCLLLLPSASLLAQRDVEVIASETQKNNETAYVLKRKVAIARFSNETQYAKGLFYDKENDPLGKQALDVLTAKLGASGKFLLIEKDDLTAYLNKENKESMSASSIGADYLIIGSVTGFGRKVVGKSAVFSSTKEQVVEATVSIRLVDVATGLVIYSDEGKGEATLTSKTTLGLGSRAGYDATLSDKAIAAAIGQLVENIINKCTDKPWRTYFLSLEDDACLIAGGKSQGIREGDRFSIYKKGKSVKNPQTGVIIQLPGKKIGSVEVLSTGGDTAETEYSFIELSLEAGKTINKEKLTDYYIQSDK